MKKIRIKNIEITDYIIEWALYTDKWYKILLPVSKFLTDPSIKALILNILFVCFLFMGPISKIIIPIIILTYIILKLWLKITNYFCSKTYEKLHYRVLQFLTFHPYLVSSKEERVEFYRKACRSIAEKKSDVDYHQIFHLLAVAINRSIDAINRDGIEANQKLFTKNVK